MTPRCSLELAVCFAVVCALASGPGTHGFAAQTRRPDPSGYSLQSWQIEEGLPYNTVGRVLQDRKGYLWFGTIGGLVRFDGATFKLFSSPLIMGPSARNIRALATLYETNLLILPAVGGLVVYDSGTFREHPAAAALRGYQWDSLFVESGGAVWVGGVDGVSRWFQGRKLDLNAADGVNRQAGTRTSFAGDSEGRVWIGSGNYLASFRDGKVARFSESLDAPIFIAPARAGGIWVSSGARLLKMDGDRLGVVAENVPWSGRGDAVREMFEEENGGLWIGTGSRGVFRFAAGEFKHVPTSHKGITSITQDREGSIWVGTSGGGVNRLREKIFTMHDSRDGLLDDVSDAVCEDHQGDIWFANRSGGVARMTAGHISQVPLQDGRLKLTASSICADDRGGMWVGTGNGLYQFPREHPEEIKQIEPSYARVHVLFKSREGDVWVGAEPPALSRFRDGDLKTFSAEDGFTGEGVRAITQDPRGRIWISTERGQLFLHSEGRFTIFAAGDGLPKVPIRALCADADGTIWAATIGRGIWLWRNGRFTGIREADGLPDDIVTQILEDDSGRFWCGSRRGIFHVMKRDLLDFVDGRSSRVEGVILGRSEGLSGVYCLLNTCQPAAWKDHSGQLLFATQQGVLALNPGVFRINTLPPPVWIEDFLVNNQPRPVSAPQKLPAGAKKIEFRFAALSYAAPERVRVKYQLEGLDTDWIETSLRSAVYGRLSPGHYRLRVKACNNDGVWNETGASLGFTVPPPWWQYWWVQGIGISVFTGMVGMSVRVWSHRRLRLRLERLEQHQALERERARIARDLHDDLGASLTQIGLLAEKAQRDGTGREDRAMQSAELTNRVRALARELDAVVWTVNPRNDSLDKLVTYLCQCSQEYFRLTPIRCRLDVGEEIPPVPLTPDLRHDLFAVAKEAMNNVIKHSRATEVWLRLKSADGVFSLELEDNGRGFKPEEAAHGERNGLVNMRVRVLQFGGSFELTSKPGGGTRISIRIPMVLSAPGKNGKSLS